MILVITGMFCAFWLIFCFGWWFPRMEQKTQNARDRYKGPEGLARLREDAEEYFRTHPEKEQLIRYEKEGRERSNNDPNNC